MAAVRRILQVAGKDKVKNNPSIPVKSAREGGKIDKTKGSVALTHMKSVIIIKPNYTGWNIPEKEVGEKGTQLSTQKFR